MQSLFFLSSFHFLFDNNMSSSRTSVLLKPYLKRFVLQIHPDFFGHDVSKQKVNATSLQRLYTLLEPALKNESHKSTKTNNNDQGIQLEFYSKSKQQHRVVQVFEPGQSKWELAQSFLNLCRQLEIAVQDSDVESVQQMVMQEYKKQQMRRGQQQQRPQSLTEQFARALYRQSSQRVNHEWTADDILRTAIFAPQVVDKRSVAERWSKWLSGLQPESWFGKLPVCFIATSTNVPKEATKGVLVFTPDMTFQGEKAFAFS